MIRMTPYRCDRAAVLTQLVRDYARTEVDRILRAYNRPPRLVGRI